MARDAFFTRDQAFAAAEAIAAEGQEVTTRTLRAYLGGGSYGTVTRYLREWEGQRQQPLSPKVDMPPMVMASFEAAWKTAMSHALKEVAAAKEKAAEEVRVIDSKLLEAIGVIEEADNEKNELKEQLVEVKKALEASESKASILAIDKATLAGVVGELKAKVENLEQKDRKAAEEMEKMREAHSSEISALMVEKAKIESARDSASDEAKKYMQRLAEESAKSSAALAKIEQKLEAVSKEKETVIKEASKLAGHLESVEKHNGELLATIKSQGGRK